MWERGCSQKKKNTSKQQTDETPLLFNSWLSLKIVQTSLLFSANKNASATHLHDLLGIPDFEEWVSTASEQQNTFPRFVSFE
jgi:hypothetical protein